MELNAYKFRRIKRGYWGETELDKTIIVKAKNRGEAEARVEGRKDARVRLQNGDYLSWRMMVFPA
jgi:hypothetical protein